MANQEHGLLVSILRAPGSLMGTVASPVWEKKAYNSAYHGTYGSLEASRDFAMDHIQKEIFILRKEDKKGEGDYYEAYGFVSLQDKIKEGKIKKDDFVLLDINQERPARAEVALAGFDFDWAIEKKAPDGAELIKEITAAVVAAVAPSAEMLQMMQMVQQMQQEMLQLKAQNIKLEKQAEDLLAEKEVKKANPVK